MSTHRRSQGERYIQTRTRHVLFRSPQPTCGAECIFVFHFLPPPPPPAGSMLALVPGMVELLQFKEWSRGQHGSEFLSNGEEGSRYKTVLQK